MKGESFGCVFMKLLCVAFQYWCQTASSPLGSCPYHEIRVWGRSQTTVVRLGNRFHQGERHGCPEKPQLGASQDAGSAKAESISWHSYQSTAFDLVSFTVPTSRVDFLCLLPYKRLGIKPVVIFLYAVGAERDAPFARQKAQRASLRSHLREKYNLPKNPADEKQLGAAGGKPQLPRELLSIKQPNGALPAPSNFPSFAGMDLGSLRTTLRSPVQSFPRLGQCRMM